MTWSNRQAGLLNQGAFRLGNRLSLGWLRLSALPMALLAPKERNHRYLSRSITGRLKPVMCNRLHYLISVPAMLHESPGKTVNLSVLR
jgi:hypothetical protein